jgi:hypothetical protein
MAPVTQYGLDCLKIPAQDRSGRVNIGGIGQNGYGLGRRRGETSHWLQNLQGKIYQSSNG